MAGQAVSKKRFDQPGHMNRAVRELLATGAKMDFFIVVVDARAPSFTMNDRLLKDFAGIPRVVVAMKSDLAEKTPAGLVPVDNAKRAGRSAVLKAVRQAIGKRVAERKKGGMVNVVSYGMVVGMPNVGKSSLINFLAQKRKADAQDRPGVTKRQQWVKITDDIQLWDTPGVLPKVVAKETDVHLASLLNLTQFKEEEFAAALKWLWSKEDGRYAKAIAGHYGMPGVSDLDQFVAAFATRREHYLPGRTLDISRALKSLFAELSSGKVLKLSLD